MREIPFVHNMRYEFDFRIMPGLTFREGAAEFFNLTMEAGNIAVKHLMENWYHTYADMNSIPIGKDPIFSDSDFEVKAVNIAENDTTTCIAIRMPDENIESIIASYHIFFLRIVEKGLLVKKPHLLIRHFTIEKSSPSNMKMTQELARIYKQEAPSPYHLCELLPNNNRRNYGNAPSDISNIDDMIMLTTECMKNTGGMDAHFNKKR